MSKAFAFIMAALALSVFVVGCTSQSAPADSAVPSGGATGATITPEAQADTTANDAVLAQTDDVTIGELI